MTPAVAPKSDGPTRPGSQAGEEKEKRFPQNPQVLKAAAEIVRRKKAEAIEKEEYDDAARFHNKLQELEAQLQVHEANGTANVGETCAATESVNNALRKRFAAGTKGEAVGNGAIEEKTASTTSRSLFAAPNPFRTVELLRQTGYSSFQAYALLGLLYAVVFAIEVWLLYAGWNFLSSGPSSSGSEEVGDDGFEEF
eukprot:TRINITY_DN21765_c0_g2_i1.p1 TRINITY_DN21765_c0_g2~~TRINITY_DN21765_c0_g2_i1.p1  ORF type:complete len:196 (-),score=47.17 TRINITY_DN21765_c0_g2_i1:44-631(-)